MAASRNTISKKPPDQSHTHTHTNTHPHRRAQQADAHASGLERRLRDAELKSADGDRAARDAAEARVLDAQQRAEIAEVQRLMPHSNFCPSNILLRPQYLPVGLVKNGAVDGLALGP